MKTVLSLSLLLSLACAGGRERDVETPREGAASSGGESGREVRLGCLRVDEDEVEREARRIPGDGSLREKKQHVMLGLVVDALAQWYEVSVEDEEVDAAVEHIRRSNGLSPEQMREALFAQGLDLTSFRGVLKRQILSTKVFAAGLGNVEGRDPEAIEERDVERFLAGAAERLREVHVEERDGRCVEAWPTVSLASLGFEGNAQIDDATLRTVAREAMGAEVLPLGPDGHVPMRVIEAWRGAYLDRGHLAARVTGPSPEGLTSPRVEIREGPAFTFGRASIRVRQGEDETSPEEDEELEAWARGVPAAPTGAFERGAANAWLEGVRDAAQARWGERVVVIPDLDLREAEGRANLRAMVILPE
ncbi:MAG: hypothetical protein KF901_08315 [Myxococcales bacterium]|nr:hypothetical protein [Myxococcales bacterium]